MDIWGVCMCREREGGREGIAFMNIWSHMLISVHGQWSPGALTYEAAKVVTPEHVKYHFLTTIKNPSLTYHCKQNQTYVPHHGQSGLPELGSASSSVTSGSSLSSPRHFSTSGQGLATHALCVKLFHFPGMPAITPNVHSSPLFLETFTWNVLT